MNLKPSAIVIACVVLLFGCIDRGRELGRDAVSKGHRNAWTQMHTTVHPNGGVSVMPIYHPASWWVNYRVRWELTDPTIEAVDVSESHWSTLELPVR